MLRHSHRDLVLALCCFSMLFLVSCALADAGPGSPLERANDLLATHLSEKGGYFVQITDTHIGGGAEEEPANNLFADRHPSERLRRLLTYLRGLDPAPDFLLITGDLTDHGGAEELARFLKILDEEWTLPVRLVRGNHDWDLEVFLEAVAGRPELEGERMARTGYCYAFDYQGARAIVLDSEEYQAGSPQAQWLEREIAQAGDTPLLPISHRQVLPTGNPLVDNWGGGAAQADGKALLESLSRAQHLLPFLCGHVHYTSRNDSDGFTQLTLTSSFYAVEDLSNKEGPLRARLCHVAGGELRWTALTDADGDTEVEWQASAENEETAAEGAGVAPAAAAG
jgi:3',5'-cyclic AMP phosphodiesterase CpdA